MKNPQAWSNQWLKELSWREIIRMNALILEANSSPTGINRKRYDRLQKELARRRKEGNGGLVALIGRVGLDKALETF